MLNNNGLRQSPWRTPLLTGMAGTVYSSVIVDVWKFHTA